VGGTFSGWTAEHYAEYRRDVPDAVITQLVEHFQLGGADCVLDLGAGTGELLIPLVRVVGYGIGLEPEPDMLAQLRARAQRECLDVVAVLASAEELPTLRRTLGGVSISLLTVANALHFMNAEDVFAHARQLLRPVGGIAVVSHGLPLWLADMDWARAVNDYLQRWLGEPTGGLCGLDDATRDKRARLLRQAGFQTVTVLRHRYSATLTPDYIVGHLYSALSQEQVPANRREDFERGLLSVLEPYDTVPLIEDVPVTALVATAPR
jgi:SAM-dependent methyltransferase